MKNAHLITLIGVLLISAQVKAATTVIVDDLDSEFSRYGPVSNWHEAAIGYGDHIYWTWNAQTTAENHARWRPNLPGAGTYAVSVYVPNDHAYTTAANYTIFHNGVADTRVVNQNIFSNVWVGLGDFFFSASGGEYVELADKTGEAYATTQIGFDAISFTLVSSTRLLGLDVKHSATVSIDWTQVHAAGISFAFSKASEGDGLTIANFAYDMQMGKNAGEVMGAYHFARPDLGNSAVAEAQYFVSIAGPYLIEGYLRPALDVEDPAKSVGWATLSQWVRD